MSDRRRSRRRHGEDEEEYDAEMTPPRPRMQPRRRDRDLDMRIDDKRREVDALRDLLLYMNKPANPRQYIDYEERLDRAEGELEDLQRRQESYMSAGSLTSRRPRMMRKSSPPRLRSSSSRLTAAIPERRKSRRTKRKVPPRDPVTGRFLPRCN